MTGNASGDDCARIVPDAQMVGKLYVEGVTARRTPRGSLARLQGSGGRASCVGRAAAAA
jgi:hypothetical protein